MGVNGMKWNSIGEFIDFHESIINRVCDATAPEEHYTGIADLSCELWNKTRRLAEDQMKINNKERKLRCNSGDNKSAVISTGSDRTSAKFSFNSDEGKKKKFIGVVVK